MDTTLRQDIKDFYALWQRVEQLYEHFAKNHRLGGVHILFTLCALHEYTEGCTQKQICEEWVMPKQTVNTILKGLETQGYLFYSPSLSDGRSKIIHLTEPGKEYIQSIIGLLSQAEARTLDSMGAGKRRAMLDGMGLFCDIFSKEIETVGNHEQT